AGANNFTMADLVLDNNQKTGSPFAAADVTDLLIERCVFRSTGVAAVSSSNTISMSGVTRTKLNDCRFESIVCVFSTSANNDVDHAELNNATVDNPYQDGIRLTNLTAGKTLRNISVRGGYVKVGGVGFMLSGSTGNQLRNVVFSGVRIVFYPKTGTVLEAMGIGDIDGFVVSGCTVDCTAQQPEFIFEIG